jgi:hypothetical protein
VKYTSSAGRNHNKPALWCLALLFFGFLIQGTLATGPFPQHNVEVISTERSLLESKDLSHSSLAITERALTPGWKTFSDLFSEYLAGKLTTPEFADNLVAEVAEAVCDHAAGVVITELLGVDLVEACVAAIYTGNAIVAPELEFLSVFGASILCNMLVAEALPGIGALTDAICKEPKPCSSDMLTDPLNCGACGNVVSSPHSLPRDLLSVEETNCAGISVPLESAPMEHALATLALVKPAARSGLVDLEEAAYALALPKELGTAWMAALHVQVWRLVVIVPTVVQGRSVHLLLVVVEMSVWERRSVAGKLLLQQRMRCS